MNFTKFFHYLSYLQYPILLAAIIVAAQPYYYGLDMYRENDELLFETVNSILILMGLGISFSSLQDTTKTQNKFSKNIWENPKKGKVGIIIFSVIILTIIAIGILNYFFSDEGILKDISIGTIVLGLGMLGMLKAAIEMFENHRKDKN